MVEVENETKLVKKEEKKMACEAEVERMEESDEPVPFQQELSCPVCQAIFRNPMLLRCTHSFCRECLDGNSKVSKKCPVCREVYTEQEAIFNRDLNSTCERFLREAHLRPNPSRGGPGGGPDCCNIHLRPLELFCVKEGELLCVDCVTLHSSDNHHKLLPLKDGASQCKAELNFKVKIFEMKVQSYKKITEAFSNAAKYVKCQAEQAEKQIKAEFERLHEALVREEALRLKALNDEEEQKMAALNKLFEDTNDDISTLNKVIQTMQREMGNEDLPFLKKFQDLKRKAEWTRKEPCLDDDSLLNLGGHVGALGYNIWKSMQAYVQYYPVVLNPNTATPWLSLNDDLTSMQESPERLTIPENPERFDPCVFVLGAEGYTAGKHKWDVVVGTNPKWVLGVCKESVARKKKFTVSTQRGVWAIALSKGVYSVLTPERSELPVQTPPERIRIKLNMDRGEVSFFDGVTAKHLVTLSQRFDEKIFPIFGPGLHSTPMILAPGKTAVHTS